MKIQSIYDINTYKVFLKYTYFKIFILGYICGLVLFLIGIYFAFSSRNSYAMYLLSGILLPLLLHIFYRYNLSESISKNKLLKYGTTQVFTFLDDGFELEQTSSYDLFKERYNYEDIYSIIKYKRYYFIYVNRVQAFIVNNDNYICGNEQELDDLFKKVKKERFIIKRSSKKASKKKIETSN